MSTAEVSTENGDPEARQQDAQRSVLIALDALDCFTDATELGATEVSRRLGIAKSTASRMLAALASRGLLERRSTGRYRLGLKLFEYGQLVVDRLMLRDMALPVLAELRDHVTETVQLGVPLGADVLYIDRLEGTNGLRFHTEAYRRKPVHSSAAGKALAAFNPYVAKAVLAAGFERHTTYTITSASRFDATLAQIRELGWSMAEEEFEIGQSSVACPVTFQRGGTTMAVAAISIAGPTQRILGPRREVIVAALLQATQKLSGALARVNI
jgi:DNA-binding IclR family transcriptional regulator